MITVRDAHTTDVNVASWNIKQPGTLLTGADDGCIRVWDLRMVHRAYGHGSKGREGDITAYTHSFSVRRLPNSLISPINSQSNYHGKVSVYVCLKHFIAIVMTINNRDVCRLKTFHLSSCSC